MYVLASIPPGIAIAHRGAIQSATILHGSPRLLSQNVAHTSLMYEANAGVAIAEL